MGESVDSADGVLRVTLAAFDPLRGRGQVRIEELSRGPGRYRVNVRFLSGGESAIDYKMGDAARRRSPLFEIGTTVKNDEVAAIEIAQLE